MNVSGKLLTAMAVVICFAASAMGGSADETWNPMEFISIMTNGGEQSAAITLILPEDASDEAVALADNIEAAWKSGDKARTSSMIDKLAGMVDMNRVNCAINYKPSGNKRCGGGISLDKSSDYYRVGIHDSIYLVEYDIDRDNGHMMAVVLLRGAGSYTSWLTYISVDNGQFWERTSALGSGGYIRDVDIAIYDNIAIVTHIYNSYDVRASKFSTADGSVQEFSNGSEYLQIYSGSNTLQQVALVSAQDIPGAIGNIFWLAFSEYVGPIHFYTAMGNGEFWSVWSAPGNNTYKGLDLCLNEVGGGFGSPYQAYMSFIGFDGNMRILGYTGSDEWVSRVTSTPGSGAMFTSIDAYENNVYCTYDYTYFGDLKVAMMNSFDGGVNWYWSLMDYEDYSHQSSDVTARYGNGVGVAYWQYVENPPYYIVSGRLKWADYDLTSWNGPTSYLGVPSADYKPCIEFISDIGKYGIMTIKKTGSEPGYAYFCTAGSCCDLAGDANGDATVNVADAVYMINYVFKGGPAPMCIHEGDANADGSLNVADAVYLINYIFKGGPEPTCP